MPSGGFPGNGGGAPPTGVTSGAARTSSGGSGPGGSGGPGGVNPMNPLSGMGGGLNLPITEILIGVGILIVVIVGLVLWRRRSKRNKVKISAK
jgi:hypothetical protein